MKRRLTPIKDPKKFFPSQNDSSMGKKFLPVRVQNPSSLQHIVRLKPGQSFNLILDDEVYDKPLVEAAGEYLKVENLGRKEKRSEYRVIQTESLHDWSRYSSCLLGEVWVDSKSTFAKLVIMLECTNAEKRDHVTMINPFYCDIRVRPYQIIEVILYDKKYSYHDKWTCIWRPKLDGLEVEQIGYDSLGLYSCSLMEYVDYDPPNYCYAKFPRAQVDQQLCRQHHFWFRFDESILLLLAENHGVLHAGDFEIQGHAGENSLRYEAGVYLDARKKYQSKMIKTLNLKRQNEYSVYTYRQNQPSSSIVHVPKRTKLKSVLPVVRDVAITPVQADSLDEGCKVLSATPKGSGQDLDLTDYDDDLIGLGRWARGKYGGIYHKVRKPWD